LDPRDTKLAGGWRKLHIEKFHNMYSSPSIIRMIKSRSMGLRGHVTPMIRKRNAGRKEITRKTET
jgi:hypothetical protein